MPNHHNHQQHPMLVRQDSLPTTKDSDDLTEVVSKILAVTRAQAQEQQTDL